MAFTYKYYHNPRCSKSREGLELLQNKALKIEIVEYLKDVPSAADFKRLFHKLGVEAPSAIRTKENIFKELKLGEKKLTQDQWFKLLAEHPVLLERPILEGEKKAAIGRPPEDMLTILK